MDQIQHMQSSGGGYQNYGNMMNSYNNGGNIGLNIIQQQRPLGPQSQPLGRSPNVSIPGSGVLNLNPENNHFLQSNAQPIVRSVGSYQTQGIALNGGVYGNINSQVPTAISRSDINTSGITINQRNSLEPNCSSLSGFEISSFPSLSHGQNPSSRHQVVGSQPNLSSGTGSLGSSNLYVPGSGLSVPNSNQQNLQQQTFQQPSPALGPMSQQLEEFVIQKEDFPALPGASSRPIANIANQSSQSSNAITIGSQPSLHSSVSAMTISSIQSDGSSAFSVVGGANGSSGVHSSTNVPASVSNSDSIISRAAAPSGIEQSAKVSGPGKYGLLGLLDVIRMTDKDLNALALGSDLTTFGLNLNSTEFLFTSFSSPYAEQTTPTEPQYNVPQCYKMHPLSLKAENMPKFLVETLFYMFYVMPRDIMQAVAAQELYRRDWRYHSELRLWLKPRSPQELLQSHPNVQFLYFDVNSWEPRLFTSSYRGNIVAGLLSEEDVKLKGTGGGGAPPQQGLGGGIGGTSSSPYPSLEESHIGH